MARFSEKAKELFFLVKISPGEVDKFFFQLDNLTDPFDVALGKYNKAVINLFNRKFSEVKSLMDELKEEKDQLIIYLRDTILFLYYSGSGNNPIVDRDRSIEYIKKLTKLYGKIDFQDEWEYNAISMQHYINLSIFESSINSNHTSAIDETKKAVKYAEYLGFEKALRNNIGAMYIKAGDFESAEIELKKVYQNKDQFMGNWYLFPINNLIKLNILKGNLDEAKKYIEEKILLADERTDVTSSYYDYSQKARVLSMEGKYEEALMNHKLALKIAQNLENDNNIFWIIFLIFYFYIQRFEMTKVEKYLEEAMKYRLKLEELKIDHEDKTFENHILFAQALILKHGGIKKKGQAIEILEILVKHYPENTDMRLHLLDLLFEDVMLTGDRETIEEIDVLLATMNTPLRTNPQAITNYVSQQILLAKYEYYIKGDVEKALNILGKAKNKMEGLKLNNLVEEIDQEIAILEGEITKWDKVDKSVKERIRESEFQKYIEKALKVASTHKDS